MLNGLVEELLKHFTCKELHTALPLSYLDIICPGLSLKTALDVLNHAQQISFKENVEKKGDIYYVRFDN